MFKKIFPLLRDIAIVIGGNIIYACGVAFFILPGGLITGGTTGIALTVCRHHAVYFIPIVIRIFHPDDRTHLSKRF